MIDSALLIIVLNMYFYTLQQERTQNASWWLLIPEYVIIFNKI